jgi:sporulation protein YlmC with PRC-barrel domain
MVEVSELNGMKVITADAFEVGEVSGAEMSKDWKITHLHIDLSKHAVNELGFKRPLLGHVTICLPVDLIKGYGDVITLTKERKALKDIPECKGRL